MLTEDQLAFREKGIGGSDAKTIMYGEAKDWQKLAAIKKGEQKATFDKRTRRLMDLGNAIEPLCLQWFSEDYAPLKRLTPAELCRVWDVEPLFRCILDGECDSNGSVPVQCKFHSGEQSVEELADAYLPQLQHEMLVTGKDSVWLAVVFGRWGAFKAIEVERDREFIDAYQMRALLFQHYWKTGEMPPELGSLTKTTANVIRLRDHVWPQGDNQVAPLACEWLNAKHYAGELEDCARRLKVLFPEDARTAKWVGPEGQGVLMKKNKSGVISLTGI